ncbi:GyrI-like domain-containing protein [Pseudomonas sp. TH08]|uniref:GyrI-like domain-containing protein n=1 Tax=unclassified Pseudomonas TaxID=196821 RepID=UPI001911E02C|nr:MULTISPECIES: GyrI-like domain-containing protein [unclassified Pseudomonas]MBK5373469.1 GyrI-like domain-containing protein [Pseudomonas sp. TH43]MBK5534339.1 GyrI-like domain-containing protein [Pseudomonas sp. TH08]
MDLKRQQINAFTVSGLSVRTTNAAEHNPETAKIGSMWGEFFGKGFTESIQGKRADSPVYGVYSAYESDASGHFDVIAGVAVDEASADFQSVTIEAGDYLVFEAQGPLPDAVIATWGKVWTFFEENPQIQRRYATDFETYTGPESVAIHIGIR